MRISTLIASADKAYTGHISDYISQYHSDTIEISTCNTAEQFSGLLSMRRYNAALIDAGFAQALNPEAVDLPMLLWSEHDAGIAVTAGGATEGYSAGTTGGAAADTAAGTAAGATAGTAAMRRIKKHKRISSTVSDILEQYAAIMDGADISTGAGNSITAVWSPCGGAGKTVVALAYAASGVKDGREVFYLNLETFSATPAYFDGSGKSISEVFEMLENRGGNVKLLVQGIRSRQDGISYLCAPENFDDINILTPDNIRELVSCCARVSGELVIDLPAVCDMRTRQVFELADNVLLVTDCTGTAKAKLSQFISQSDIYAGIRDKLTVIVNKHTGTDDAAEDGRNFRSLSEQVVFLPLVQSSDEQYVYKTLAGHLSGR